MSGWDKTPEAAIDYMKAFIEDWYSSLKPCQRTKAASDLVAKARAIRGSIARKEDA